MGFLYYSASRPLGPGCFPKPADNSITEIINYNERVYVSSIGRSVWGSIEYSSPLTETDISAYELIPFPVKKEDGYRKMAKAAVSARMDYIQKKTDEVRKRAETLGITEEENSVHGS